MGRNVDVDDLVNPEEIAERLGLAQPQAVHNYRRRYPDFPQPVRQWGRFSVWSWPDVEEWARATGRLP